MLASLHHLTMLPSPSSPGGRRDHAEPAGRGGRRGTDAGQDPGRAAGPSFHSAHLCSDCTHAPWCVDAKPEGTSAARGSLRRPMARQQQQRRLQRQHHMSAMHMSSCVTTQGLRGSCAESDSTCDHITPSDVQTPGASLHWYGKAGISAGRKLGHVTITAGADPGPWLALSMLQCEASCCPCSSSCTTPALGLSLPPPVVKE